MYDRSLVRDMAVQIEEAINRIERRFEGISCADDFVKSDEGIDRLDAIAMMLIAIGESFKNIDKITGGTLLARYPEIYWPGVKGVRDILAHAYFNIDPDEIFAICSKDLAPLKAVAITIKAEHG